MVATRPDVLTRPTSAPWPRAMPSVYDLDRAALAELLADQPALPGRPGLEGPLRAGRHRRGADRPAQGGAGPAARQAAPAALTPVTESVSDDGETVKWLWGLEGGAQVETVLMHYDDRSHGVHQHPGRLRHGRAGSAPPGQAGFERHLSVGEIVEQVVRARRRAQQRDEPRRVSNVVFMGMGEPLANYDRTWAAVERLHGDMGISARHLTVSTVGIVPGHHAAGRRGPAGEPGRVAPRGQRHAARRAGAHQPPLSRSPSWPTPAPAT